MNLKNNLNEKGFRLTKQRQAVMEVVLNTKGKHLSSVEIFEMVRRSHPNIGLATVYRTLPLLEKMNLLSKISLDDGYIRYEVRGLKEQGHHHLICIKCGTVCEIEEELLGASEKQILIKNQFTAVSYSFKIFGCCIKCAEENR